MLSDIEGAAILRHRTSDVSQIVYVTGALWEKAQLGAGLAQNCSALQYGSALNPTKHVFGYNYTVINYLVTLFVHN